MIDEPFNDKRLIYDNITREMKILEDINRLAFLMVTPHITLLYTYFFCDDCRKPQGEKLYNKVAMENFDLDDVINKVRKISKYTDERYQDYYRNFVSPNMTENEIKQNALNMTVNDFDLDVYSFVKLPCYLAVVELADEDLTHWAKSIRSQDQWIDALTQILLGLYPLQKHLSIQHNDLHTSNILVSFVTQKKGYFRYIINGESYYRRNTGFIFKIWDFGKSKKDIYKIGDLYDFNNLMSDIWNKGLLSDIFDEYLGNFWQLIKSEGMLNCIIKNLEDTISEDSNIIETYYIDSTYRTPTEKSLYR